jgi:hypothetical protein
MTDLVLRDYQSPAGLPKGIPKHAVDPLPLLRRAQRWQVSRDGAIQLRSPLLLLLRWC